MKALTIGGLTVASVFLLMKLRSRAVGAVRPVQCSRAEIAEKIVENYRALIRTDSLDPGKTFLHPKTLSGLGEERFLNPILGSGSKKDVNSGQAYMSEAVFSHITGYVNADSAFYPEILQGKSVYLIRGNPKREIVMSPKSVRAAIVTCGGLCPGLNVVIRELVMSLHYNYGASQVFGIFNGYKGFYTPGCIKPLTPLDVMDIHTRGGTILKSSRGGWDLEKIADAIELQGFNQIYIIGGDGTHRGITALVAEMERRNRPIAIVGVPKTIDNDIPIIDKSFGFDTSIEEAQRAIDSADVEANSVEFGVGLVKLMGRNSGFIALNSSISNRNVNLCLIPECPYELKGPGGVYAYVADRLRKKGHAVVVVAEGAASACVDEKLQGVGTDASGNPTLYDIGKHLKEGITAHCKAEGINITLKYIDPTYMIRTVGANASDRMLCTMLAQAAVHGAFGGFTGFSVGTVAGQIVYIPVDLMTTTHEGKGSISGQRKVDIDNNMTWWRLVASTGQPAFRN